MAPLAEALAAAAAIVSRVAGGRSLASESERPTSALPSIARAAITDLCYGTLRNYGRGQAILSALSRRSLPLDPLVEALLWSAVYALESGRYATYTVVDQAVSACLPLGRPRAKSFVNGVLRAYLRARPGLAVRLDADPVAHFRHPQWWIDRVRRAYPGEWQQVLAAGNAQPPMCVRVNARRTTVEQYLETLRTANLEARRVGPVALLLQRPTPVERLPGFSTGEVSVQDAGAQRAARLLDLKDGQRVLDACAAPGGKSAHILESAEVRLTALDVDRQRSERIQRDLGRLGLGADVRVADCTVLDDWWDGAVYERVLADVPCSGSGVVRRRPDIKWLRRESDIAAFAERQGGILDALWRVLAPSGKLLYVTCSVFPEENEAVVQAFAARGRAVRRLPLPPDTSAAQLLPGGEHDGFYFALLEKTA